MNDKQIYDRLATLISDRFDVPVSDLTEETRQKDLGIDSILLVDLMLDIETELDFVFESIDLPSNPSLGEIVTLIRQNLTKSGSATPANRV